MDLIFLHLSITWVEDSSEMAGWIVIRPPSKGNVWCCHTGQEWLWWSHESKCLVELKKAMAPHSSTLAWKIPRTEEPVGCSPWGLKESDMTEWLHFHFHALEKEMATHSSVLAWRIPGTGEPGGLPSMGSHRVRHDWSDLAAAAAARRLLVQDFPYGPVAKTLHSQCRRPRFDPWSGN